MNRLLLPLAVLLCVPALAAPLPNKEWGGHKKAVARAAKAKNWARAAEAIEALSGDDSKRAVDLLCKLVVKHKHPIVFRAVVDGLAGVSSDEAVTRLCEKALKGKLASRLAAIDACGRQGGGASADALVSALDTTQEQVQRTAVYALRKRKMLTAMDPLIALLGTLQESDPDSLNTTVVREALEALTGVRLELAEDWATFWAKNKAGFRPRTGQEKAVDGASTRTRPTFFGTEIVSNRLVFVIDVSGSMKEEDLEWTVRDLGKGRRPKTGGKPKPVRALPTSGSRVRIERAKFQLKQAIDALPSRAKFTIIAYSGYIQDATLMGGGYRYPPDVPEKGPLPEVIAGVRWLLVWKSKLTSANERGKASAKAFADRLHPAGSTFTLRALKAALRVPGANTIILLSDGYPTEIRGRVAEKLLTAEEILDEVRGFNRLKRIRIDTFGVGIGDEDNFGRFLADLAKQNNGRYTEVR